MGSTHTKMTHIGQSTYAIYIFQTSKQAGRMPQWKRIKATKSLKRAMLYVRLLSRNAAFEKIEIKKRYFLKSENRYVGATIGAIEKGQTFWQNAKNTLTLFVLETKCALGET